MRETVEFIRRTGPRRRDEHSRANGTLQKQDALAEYSAQVAAGVRGAVRLTLSGSSAPGRLKIPARETGSVPARPSAARTPEE